MRLEINVADETTMSEFFKYCKNGWEIHKVWKFSVVGSEGITSIGVSQIASGLFNEVEIIHKIGTIIKKVISNKIAYEVVRVTILLTFVLAIPVVFCLLCFIA